MRGTVVGANNRLDLLKILTTGVDKNELKNRDNILSLVEGWEEDESHDPDVPAVSHNRGMTPFVFVPFEEVWYILVWNSDLAFLFKEISFIPPSISARLVL